MHDQPQPTNPSASVPRPAPATVPAPGPGVGAMPEYHPRAAAVVAQRAPQLPPSLTGPPDPLGLLRALRRRLGLALGLGICAAVLVGGTAWVVVPRAKYTAEALLIVSATPPRVLFETVETSVQEDYARYQKTQVAKLRSREVIEAVLRQPGVAEFRTVRAYEDPVEGLLQDLDVGFSGNSELLAIRLSGDVPEELARLVNEVVAAYMSLRVNEELNDRVRRRDALMTHKVEYAETLRTRRQDMERLAKTVGTSDRDTLVLKQQFAEQHLAMLQGELLKVRSDRRRLEAELDLLERKPELTPADEATQLSDAELDQLVEAHPAVMQLNDQLAEVQLAYDRRLEQVARIDRRYLTDPMVVRYRGEADRLKRELEATRRQLRPIIVRQFQEHAQGRGSDPTRGIELRQDLALYESLEKQLAAELEQLRESSQNLNINTIDLQAIQDDIKQVEVTADQINREIEWLKVELQAPPRIQTLEKAVPPRQKSEKKRYTTIAMATMGSFAACLFGISFLEFRTRKLNSAEEVVLGLGIPMVGALPRLPARARSGRGEVAVRKGQDRYWHNLLLESVDATRTMLLHAARTEGHRLIMITSAMAGEGKTSLSCHLAISLARGGQRTLLIDGDLRRPGVSRLFDLPPGPGLSEVLRGQAAPEEAIVPMPVEGLDALMAGQCDERALRALICGELGPLFARLKTQYDFVIVDSSPVLPVAEAQLIAQASDAVLFSILRDVSRAPKVYAAHQRLSVLGARILGAVMTGAHGGLYGNDYRYSSYGRTEPPAAPPPAPADQERDPS